MSTITVEELVRNPTGLIDRITAGEYVLVERDGRPVAEVRPAVAPRTEARPYGLCSGTSTVPDDFDSPLPDDVLDGFEGR